MVDFQRQQIRNRPTCNEEASPLGDFCWWCCVISLLLGLVLGYAWFHNQRMDVSYQIEKLKIENARMRETNAALRAEQAVLVAPERIYREAERMGLVSPDQQSVRILQASVVQVPGDAVVAQAVPSRKSLHE